MKYFLIFLASYVSFITPSWAQDVRSEFLFQADEGQSFIQANVQNFKLTQKEVGGAESDSKDLNFFFAYEKGMSDLMSIYGNLGYGKAELAGGFMEAKGLNPINLGAKFRMAMGSGELYARTNLGVGLLEKSSCDTAGTTISCNRTDGSLNLALRLGYLWSFDSAFFGMAIDYGLFSTDAKSKDGFESEKSGSLLASVFYEWLMADMIIGGLVNYSTGGGVLQELRGSFTDKDASDIHVMGLKLYTRVPLYDNMTFLGAVIYDTIVNEDDDLADGGSGFGLNFGLRIAL